MRRLKSSPLLRNVMAVASGTAAGQAVVFAFSPLITRIYSPESFGLQGVFLSLISILSPAIALRYPMAIVVAGSDAEAKYISRISVIIAFALSVFLGFVLLIAKEPLLMILGAEALGPLIFFLPLALFCVALQDISNFGAARERMFRLVGIVTAIQAFLSNIARVFGGLISPVAETLLLVTSFSPAVQAALLKLGRQKCVTFKSNVNFREAFDLLRRYSDFPLFRVPTDMLNAASQSIPVILLAALFSPIAAGLYTLTRSVLNLPSNVIGAAVGNVIYARFAEMSREGQPLLPLLMRTTMALMTLAPIIIGISYFAPPVFSFLFGEDWREAGHYAQWMSLWLGVSIANVPAIRIAPVIHAQKILLIANVVVLAMRFICIYLVYLMGGDASLAVSVFSVVSLVSNVGIVIAILYATSAHDEFRSKSGIS